MANKKCDACKAVPKAEEMNRIVQSSVIFHVPHSSKFIPSEVRDDFLLTDEEMSHELKQMTDHLTLELVENCLKSAAIVNARTLP